MIKRLKELEEENRLKKRYLEEPDAEVMIGLAETELSGLNRVLSSEL